ncbi:uncharacterized protein EHS24_002210 [Apiotrichum porosum]|uniref:BRCT domain-containing protein n=1 Tax=Apiotrichum porosum TaxID=105984 RepID=A0A427XHY3_9TREE|nr:uncharacterized protein EHS24_002210 [Apiotrichum porosum]RSH78485.1 hypothetical protein EHS24_002210 [Apiotrichum porosum]
MSDTEPQPVIFKRRGDYDFVTMAFVGKAVRYQTRAEKGGVITLDIDEHPWWIVLDQEPGNFTCNMTLLLVADICDAVNHGTRLVAAAWVEECLEMGKETCARKYYIDLPPHPDTLDKKKKKKEKKKGAVMVTDA